MPTPTAYRSGLRVRAAALSMSILLAACGGSETSGGGAPPSSETSGQPGSPPTEPSSSGTAPDPAAAEVDDPGLDGPAFSLDDPKCKSDGAMISCSDVVYSEVAGTELHLDLYAPLVARTARVPALMYVHGGGWAHGTYHQPGLDLEGNIAAGRAVLSIEYRLTLAGGKPTGLLFPEDLRDVKTAVRWMKTKAAGFIDGERILAYGFSAGAHLVSLLSTTAKVAAFEGRGPLSVPSTVKAVVALSSPFDFHLFVPQNPALDPTCPAQKPGDIDPRYAIALLLGGGDCCTSSDCSMLSPACVDYLEAPERGAALTNLSAMTYLDATAAPLLAFAGTCDLTVPHHGAEELNEAAKAIPQVRAVIVPGATHGSTLKSAANKQAVADFIEEQVGP